MPADDKGRVATNFEVFFCSDLGLLRPVFLCHWQKELTWIACRVMFKTQRSFRIHHTICGNEVPLVVAVRNSMETLHVDGI